MVHEHLVLLEELGLVGVGGVRLIFAFGAEEPGCGAEDDDEDDADEEGPSGSERSVSAVIGVEGYREAAAGSAVARAHGVVVVRTRLPCLRIWKVLSRVWFWFVGGLVRRWMVQRSWCIVW